MRTALTTAALVLGGCMALLSGCPPTFSDLCVGETCRNSGDGGIGPSGCNNIANWTHVALLVDGGSCPSGFEGEEHITAPYGGNCTCSSSCDVLTAPDCSSVTLSQLSYTPEADAGKCGVELDASIIVSDTCTDFPRIRPREMRANVTARNGGTCKFASSGSGDVSGRRIRLCKTNDTILRDRLCANRTDCIEGPAGQECTNPDYPAKHVVSDKVTLTCTDCGCSSNTVCEGVLRLYREGSSCPASSPDAVDLVEPPDCRDVAAGGSAVYTYTAARFTDGLARTPTCQKTSESQATHAPKDNVRTVCCRQ